MPLKTYFDHHVKVMELKQIVDYVKDNIFVNYPHAWKCS